MISKKITISKNFVLTLDQADVLAKAAEHCRGTVELVVDNNIINCRSILNILSLVMRKDEIAELRCTGPSEEQDLEYMLHVIRTKFENGNGEQL